MPASRQICTSESVRKLSPVAWNSGRPQGVETIVGVVPPAYCRSIFIRNGWELEWPGEVGRSIEGHGILAGALTVSEAVLRGVREKTAFITMS
jgi:hypothetical protein